jgi:hypothetical protein
MAPSDIVPGRSCAGCTLCCKVLGIPELTKPRGIVCGYCAWGTGCRIYERRPGACADFDCSYLLSPALGEEWKPITSHLVLGYMAKDDVILIFTDPDHVGAWRKEPYISRIKGWARSTDTGYVLVWEQTRVLALLGADEFDLGRVTEDQVIVREQRAGGRAAIYVTDKDAARLTLPSPAALP